MGDYRKKPVMIQAELWDGSDESYDKIEGLAAEHAVCTVGTRDGELYITTLEGEMHAEKGDFIIQGVEGEVYPCKPEIFWKTYEDIYNGQTDWPIFTC